jgi:hypothetical protein
MMMYQAPPLYFPDGTDYDTIQDAILSAKWVWVNSPNRVRTINLCDKCGSCKHFEAYLTNEAYGSCPLHPTKDRRARSIPKCKDYEKKEL